MSGPVVKIRENEEEMCAANNAVGYYESMDSISCPEYPGF